MTATPGQQLVKTSTDFRGEIRRGEAMLVGEYWYRVGSAIGSGAAGEQIQRAAAPTSVTIGEATAQATAVCVHVLMRFCVCFVEYVICLDQFC